jgi:hypothetical protein
MMLDHVEIRAEAVRAEGLVEVLLQVTAAATTLKPVADRSHVWRMPRNERQARKHIRVRIMIHGDVPHLLEIDLGFVQTVRNGRRWKAGPMFDACEPLLFGGRDNRSFAQKARRSVTVETVHTENECHDDRPLTVRSLAIKSSSR